MKGNVKHRTLRPSILTQGLIVHTPYSFSIMRLFTYGLFVVGLVFLGMTAKVLYDGITLPDNKRLFLITHEELDYNKLLSSSLFETSRGSERVLPDQVVALYVMPSETCSHCLNDVYTYTRHFNEEGFAGRPVQNRVIVLEPDRRRAARRMFALSSGKEARPLARRARKKSVLVAVSISTSCRDTTVVPKANNCLPISSSYP